MNENQILSKIKKNLEYIEELYKSFDISTIEKVEEENRQLYIQLSNIKRKGLNGVRRYKINDKYIVECNSLDDAKKILATQYAEEYKGGSIVEVDINGNSWCGADFALIAK